MSNLPHYAMMGALAIVAGLAVATELYLLIRIAMVLW